jgi:hypothetical protein
MTGMGRRWIQVEHILAPLVWYRPFTGIPPAQRGGAMLLTRHITLSDFPHPYNKSVHNFLFFIIRSTHVPLSNLLTRVAGNGECDHVVLRLQGFNVRSTL